MKTIRYTLMLSAFALAGCGQPKSPSTNNEGSAADGARTLSIDAVVLRNAHFDFAKAAPAEISDLTTAFGEVVLNTDKVASIVSRVEGVIYEDRKQLGDPVKAGETMAIIESQSLAASIVAYLQTERDRRFALATFDREKTLYNKKLASSEDYHQAEQAFHKALIAHAAALQPLQLLNFEEAQMHSYLDNPDKANLTRFSVTSPISGVVTKKSLIKGEAVAADNQLFVVADLSNVWVDFQVPLNAVSGLKAHDAVKVSFAGGELQARATIKYVAPIANETNRAVEVQATMANSGGWRPGSPVTVTFAKQQSKVEVAVPSEALLDFEGGFVIFVQKSEQTFELRQVIPGKRDDAMVAIEEGLAAGEIVVTTNAFLLKAQWQMGSDA